MDTDKVMQFFFKTCADAGPFGCPFYAPTPEDVQRNLTKLYDSVRAKPIPVRTETSYGLLDYNHLRLTVFIRLTLHSSHLQEAYLSLRLVMQPCSSKCSNHHPLNALLNHLRTLSMSSQMHKVLFSVMMAKTSQATLILRDDISR